MPLITVTVCVTVTVELPPVVDVPVSLTLPLVVEVGPVFVDELPDEVFDDELPDEVFDDELPDELFDDELGQVEAVVRPALVVLPVDVLPELLRLLLLVNVELTPKLDDEEELAPPDVLVRVPVDEVFTVPLEVLVLVPVNDVEPTTGPVVVVSVPPEAVLVAPALVVAVVPPWAVEVSPEEKVDVDPDALVAVILLLCPKPLELVLVEPEPMLPPAEVLEKKHEPELVLATCASTAVPPCPIPPTSVNAATMGKLTARDRIP